MTISESDNSMKVVKQGDMTESDPSGSEGQECGTFKLGTQGIMSDEAALQQTPA